MLISQAESKLSEQSTLMNQRLCDDQIQLDYIKSKVFFNTFPTSPVV